MSEEKLPIEVKEAQEGIADIRICATERIFQDDLEGECSECKSPLFYRPEPPFLAKFLCLTCAAPILAKDPNFVVTVDTAKFLASMGIEVKVKE